MASATRPCPTSINPVMTDNRNLSSRARSHVRPTRTLLLLAAALICFASSCSRAKSKIIVGGKSTTTQSILAEVIAQQLESGGMTVERRLNMGGTALTYQALLMTEIDAYAEGTGSIVASVLNETPDKDPNIVLERVRGELVRLARVQFIGPLGLDDPFAISILAPVAATEHTETIGEAARIKWNFGSTSDFQMRTNGNTALQTTYSLPLRSYPKTFDTTEELYRALVAGQINMAAGNMTDAGLSNSNIVILKDDKGAFPAEQMGIVVRQDVLKAFPQMEGVLGKLKGRLNVPLMRKLNAQVEVQHRPVHDVAADFLAGRLQ